MLGGHRGEWPGEVKGFFFHGGYPVPRVPGAGGIYASRLRMESRLKRNAVFETECNRLTPDQVRLRGSLYDLLNELRPDDWLCHRVTTRV
jgi:hypothetical protein